MVTVRKSETTKRLDNHEALIAELRESIEEIGNEVFLKAYPMVRTNRISQLEDDLAKLYAAHQVLQDRLMALETGKPWWKLW